MNNYLSLTLIACLYLSACSAVQPIKLSNNTSDIDDSALSSRQHFEIGSRLFNRWLESESATDGLVADAEKHFKIALDAHPSNVLYQITHYNAYATGRSNFIQFDEGVLLEQFNKLHPELRAEAITPAFISYTLSSINQSTLDVQISHIQRAIKQNPTNPQNWLVASELYRQKGQYWLALSSIINALNIHPDSPEYNEQLGHNLFLMLEQSDCHPLESKILKRSASAYSNAARLAKNNANDYAWASEAYLRLGLPPLALAQAKKAYSLEANETTSYMLFNALFFNAKFDKAWETLSELEQIAGAKYYDFDALKLWYQTSKGFNKEMWSELARTFASADASNGSNFYALLSRYQFQLSNEEHQKILKANTHKLNSFEQETLDLLNSADHKTQIESYLNESKNQCESDRRDFFALATNAMRNDNWQDNDRWPIRLSQEDYWRFMFRHAPRPSRSQ